MKAKQGGVRFSNPLRELRLEGHHVSLKPPPSNSFNLQYSAQDPCNP